MRGQTPAPFNPATLARIRQGASAADLWWNEDRYRRVCRDHGIEPAASALSAPANVAPSSPFHEILFDDLRGFLTINHTRMMFKSPCPITVFGVLLQAARKGNDSYFASSVFRSPTGRIWSRAHISRAVESINDTLAGSGFKVESKDAVGYRLIVVAP